MTRPGFFEQTKGGAITTLTHSKPDLSLGSLFDGIGGFPYAGTFFGITPVWASEILPCAVSVTRRHLPGMTHVGDITKLDGAKLPPVDIISFGSPCQGLSMAGKRLGLADERSGLFSEAIRIIDEMREATNGKYPRYALWENVPGALSSGAPRGADFKAVLEAFTKTELPFPRSGRWANAGMVRGRGVDLAWVIYDSQRFGTSQRRRRIFLVVDFGGESAGEILFVPQSLRGYFAAGGTPRQGPAAYAAGGITGADDHRCPNGDALVNPHPAIAMRIRSGCEGGGKGPLLQTERSGALATGNDQTLFSPCLTPWDAQSRRVHDADGTWPALYGGDGGGRGYVAKEKGHCLNPWDTQNARVTTGDGIAPTLAGADGCGGRNPGGLVLTEQHSDNIVCLNDQGGQRMDVEQGEQAPTLRSVTKGNLPIVARKAYPINTQTAMRHEALGEGTGLGVGEAGAPAYTLQQAHSHAVAVEDSPVICRATALANAETLVDKSATLTCYHEQPIICKAVHQNQEGGVTTSDTAYALTTASNASARNAPLVMAETWAIAATAIGRQPLGGGNGLGINRDVSPTLTATDRHAVSGRVHPEVSGTLCASGAGLSRPAGMANETDLCVAYCLQGNMLGREDENGPEGAGVNEDISYTLNTRDHVEGPPQSIPSLCGERMSSEMSELSPQGESERYAACDDEVAAVDCRNLRETQELSGTLQAKESGGYSLNSQNPVRTGYIVRRLTPTECERLQGFPDGWTALDEHGKPISDSKRYQMLGNSVAVPCVAYILQGMARRLKNVKGGKKKQRTKE